MEKHELISIIDNLQGRVEWLETMLFQFHIDHEKRLIDLEPKLHTMEKEYY
jgi:hypothetical protein